MVVPSSFFPSLPTSSSTSRPALSSAVAHSSPPKVSRSHVDASRLPRSGTRFSAPPPRHRPRRLCFSSPTSLPRSVTSGSAGLRSSRVGEDSGNGDGDAEARGKEGGERAVDQVERRSSAAGNVERSRRVAPSDLAARGLASVRTSVDSVATTLFLLFFPSNSPSSRVAFLPPSWSSAAAVVATSRPVPFNPLC